MRRRIRKTSRRRKRTPGSRSRRSGVFYDKPRHQRLAEEITITSHSGFKRSVKKLSSKKSYSTTEYRALVLARTRAKLMARKKNLKPETRKRLKAIANTPIPKPKK